MRDSSTLGVKLLPKIVSAVSQTVISVRRGLAPLDHHVRVKATWDVFSKIGEELADHYGPLIDAMLEQDTSSVHPSVVQWLQDTRSGEQQAKAISGILFGAGQSALSTFISNEIAPLVYHVVSLNPNLVPDPGLIAQTVAARIDTNQTGLNVASYQGYGGQWWQSMRDLAFSWPGAGDAFEMRRRGLISDSELTLILERNAIPAEVINQYKGLVSNELSLADAALAYLRSDITLAQAQEIATANGYNAEKLNVFIGNTGEPPGPDQLLDALRRDIIDKATAERGIKQSRIRNEWIDTLLALRYAPMSTADAVNAVVQNHLSQGEAQKIAEQNGLQGDQFATLIESAGEPLSRTELEQLYNRGLIDETTVEQGLRESRLKNKYVKDAFQLRVRLLEPRMLASAVQYGAITHEEAVKRALEQGYSEADAQILVAEGSNRKLYTRKQQALTAAETLYEDEAISETDLRNVAKASGLDATETDQIVRLAEYKREAKFTNGVITVIRSKYVSHHITKSQASGYLDKLTIPSARRDQLLVIWDLERSATTRELTEAQIAKAVKLQLITPEQGLVRLTNAGYSEGDAKLLLEGA